MRRGFSGRPALNGGCALPCPFELPLRGTFFDRGMGLMASCKSGSGAKLEVNLGE